MESKPKSILYSIPLIIDSYFDLIVWGRCVIYPDSGIESILPQPWCKYHIQHYMNIRIYSFHARHWKFLACGMKLKMIFSLSSLVQEWFPALWYFSYVVAHVVYILSSTYKCTGHGILVSPIFEHNFLVTICLKTILSCWNLRYAHIRTVRINTE